MVFASNANLYTQMICACVSPSVISRSLHLWMEMAMDQNIPPNSEMRSLAQIVEDGSDIADTSLPSAPNTNLSSGPNASFPVIAGLEIVLNRSLHKTAVRSTNDHSDALFLDDGNSSGIRLTMRLGFGAYKKPRANHGPSAFIIEPYPTSAKWDTTNPSMRATRTSFMGARPLVRLTSQAEIPNRYIPPLLTWKNMEVLCYWLPATDRQKGISNM
ncbi:hypothetical protein GYMLUDRAFT_263806 [Collybiopsis luxurians FD-317 M1]|uniref:Unplaced genomic scaffold GYMLUscaffold_52, whole genome shotgun sequence n=1 Tax=Collybiopsis luxurians FD-317 M1 TaxID=944289 RepID=A0A0D0BMJ3_9AGAR|nr:hypothetical protein GYMLUDRAFT_263806 [Collybiopsis luxurians FD-317 M1]